MITAGERRFHSPVKRFLKQDFLFKALDVVFVWIDRADGSLRIIAIIVVDDVGGFLAKQIGNVHFQHLRNFYEFWYGKAAVLFFQTP